MLHVIRNARIAVLLHRKSNHIFTVWQHMVLLLVIRQYRGKSYRQFSEWLVEAYYLRMFLQLSHIPHFTTLQKFIERVNGTALERKISSFIVLTNIRQIFVGVDSAGFKATHASQVYTERAELRRRKYIKVSLSSPGSLFLNIEDTSGLLIIELTGIAKFSPRSMVLSLVGSYRSNILKKNKGECGLHYDQNGLEYLMWMLSLISLSWMIENLGQKQQWELSQL